MALQTIAPDEMVILLILLAGYLPILVMYLRRRNAMLLFLSYTALLVGGFAEVVQNFAYYGEFVTFKSAVGVFGAGLLFFLCAYFSYKQASDLHNKIDLSAKSEMKQIKTMASGAKSKMKQIKTMAKEMKKASKKR